MKYLVVECHELRRYNLTNYIDTLMNERAVAKSTRASVPSWSPTGIIPRVNTTFFIPESSRYYALLGYTGIGWIKIYDDATQ